MSHSPEPWRVVTSEKFQCRFVLEGDRQVLDVPPGLDTNDLDRIIACVNACRGIPTEWLEETLRRLIVAMVHAGKMPSGDPPNAKHVALSELQFAASNLYNDHADLDALLAGRVMEKPA